MLSPRKAPGVGSLASGACCHLGGQCPVALGAALGYLERCCGYPGTADHVTLICHSWHSRWQLLCTKLVQNMMFLLYQRHVFLAKLTIIFKVWMHVRRVIYGFKPNSSTRRQFLNWFSALFAEIFVPVRYLPSKPSF